MKIFGIGFGRTGTSSLSRALRILGYSIRHYPNNKETRRRLASGIFNLPVIDKSDGITDNPVVPYYPQFDVAYPNSKFILTVRDLDDWLDSAKASLRGRSKEERLEKVNDPNFVAPRNFFRLTTFGIGCYDRERFAWVYECHMRNVRAYFKDRPNDYLELAICDGEGWEKLCPFLGKEIPNEPFPHANARRVK